MSQSNESMSAQSWEYTRGYAGVFGTPPAPFSTAIRALLNDESNGAGQPSGSTLYQLLRLVKSPSLFAPFYFAASNFEPTVISGNSRTPEAAILKSFSSFEIAALLAVIYLLRRAQVVCDAEELKYIEKDLIDEVNLSLAIGRAIPALGGGLSLLQAAAPLLGLAAFLRHDPAGFKEYRRTLKKSATRWDTDLEMQRWGCSRIQVGSVLAQSLGFGIRNANAIINGLTSLSQSSSEDEVDVSRDVKMAALWCDSIRATKKAPEVALAARYYPTNSALQAALETLDSLQRDSNQAAWLLKGKEDIPPYQRVDATGRACPVQAQDEFEAMQADLSSIDTNRDLG